MPRFLFVVLLGVVASSAIAALPAIPTEVAIIHYDKLQEGNPEGTAKDVTLAPLIGSPDETPLLQVINMRLAPRKITVRILGLTAPEYDLYMDMNADGTPRKSTIFLQPGDPPKDPHYPDFFIRTMKKEELEAGIAVALPGTAISAADRGYYAELRKRAAAAAQYYKNPTTGDGSICRAALEGAARWAEEAQNGDYDSRSTRIVISPKGRTPQVAGVGFSVPMDPAFVEPSTLGSNMQVMRRNVRDMVGDPISRNDTLQSITPVDFRLMIDKTTFTPGKHVVKAVVQNWTDQVITGKVTLFAPAGWKVKPLNSSVRMAGYGKASSAKFEVTVPKTVKPDSKLSAIATLDVDGVEIKYLTK